MSVPARHRATEAAVAALAARDRALPALAVLLDAGRLSDALGHPVRVTRRRWKPGTDVVVAFESDAGHGWIAAYADPAKLAKTRERARRSGADLRELPHLAAISGPVLADRELSPTLRRLERTVPGLLAGACVLRHNPHRRLVLAEGGRVVKVVARGSAGAMADVVRVQVGLAARGIPVLAPTLLQTGATSTPWWGSGDLSALRSSPAEPAAAAGAALARLHALDDLPVPAAPRGEVATAARAVGGLAPELTPRLERLVRALDGPVGRRGIVHGDFSADQVLVGDGVRLIDFDRVHRDEPERDLGTFLAAEPDRSAAGAALVDGYRAEGGLVDPEALVRRTASAVLLRAVEPFRTAQPDWRDRIESELARAEAVLGC